jgi:OOP family OmpA-OmpF porin
MRSMSKFGVVRCLSALLVVAVTMTACANGRPTPIACAVVGGLLGAGGAGVAATHIDGAHDDEYVYPIGAAGGILLGTAGYFICKALQAEEDAPPPPAPAPAPRGEEPAPMAEKIVLRGVNFDFDKADIRPDAAVILDEAASILNANPGKSVRVEGHTDSVGADRRNARLSQRRADAVRRFLIDEGIEERRIQAVGRGEERPISDNTTPEGRANNRRVELVLTPTEA